MNSLVFYSCDNTKGKRDATGAFIPESRRLLSFLKKLFPGYRHMRIAIRTKGLGYVARMKQVEDTFYHEKKKGRIYDAVFFLCHGYKHGIQYGYKWKSGAERLSDAILEHNPAVQMVTFYSCLVAKDRSNFQSWIFEEIEPRSTAWDFQVFGHYTRGHTTKNPRIKIHNRGYLPFIWSSKPVVGYNELVSPKQNKTLTALLRKHKSDLRFAIPFYPRVLKKYSFTDSLKRSVLQ